MTLLQAMEDVYLRATNSSILNHNNDHTVSTSTNINSILNSNRSDDASIEQSAKEISHICKKLLRSLAVGTFHLGPQSMHFQDLKEIEREGMKMNHILSFSTHGLSQSHVSAFSQALYELVGDIAVVQSHVSINTSPSLLSGSGSLFDNPTSTSTGDHDSKWARIIAKLLRSVGDILSTYAVRPRSSSATTTGGMLRGDGVGLGGLGEGGSTSGCVVHQTEVGHGKATMVSGLLHPSSTDSACTGNDGLMLEKQETLVDMELKEVPDEPHRALESPRHLSETPLSMQQTSTDHISLVHAEPASIDTSTVIVDQLKGYIDGHVASMK
ncbi:hypothetical protein HDU76_003848, partial [Blyttiomyces sp. JEL0837]